MEKKLIDEKDLKKIREQGLKNWIDNIRANIEDKQEIERSLNAIENLFNFKQL